MLFRSTAYLLTDRLSVMIFLSAAIGASAAVIGLYFSFTYNLASGATIVLAATALFFIAFLFSPKQGILWKKIKDKKNRHVLQKGNI